MSRLINVMLKLPDGDTLTARTDRASLSRKRGQAAMEALADDRHIVACLVIKGNTERTADFVGRNEAKTAGIREHDIIGRLAGHRLLPRLDHLLIDPRTDHVKWYADG